MKTSHRFSMATAIVGLLALSGPLGAANISPELQDLIKKAKGKLAQEYLWGRRKLAYQIANQDFGVYHIWYLTGSGTMLDELHKQFRFTDELLRFQSIMVEDVDEEALSFSEMLKVQQEEASARAASVVTVTKEPDKKVEANSDTVLESKETKEPESKKAKAPEGEEAEAPVTTEEEITDKVLKAETTETGDSN